MHGVSCARHGGALLSGKEGGGAPSSTQTTVQQDCTGGCVLWRSCATRDSYTGAGFFLRLHAAPPGVSVFAAHPPSLYRGSICFLRGPPARPPQLPFPRPWVQGLGRLESARRGLAIGGELVPSPALLAEFSRPKNAAVGGPSHSVGPALGGSLLAAAAVGHGQLGRRPSSRRGLFLQLRRGERAPAGPPLWSVGAFKIPGSHLGSI